MSDVPKLRVLKTSVYTGGFFPDYKTYQEIQYLDPTEGWTNVPVEYRHFGSEGGLVN